MTGRRRAYIVVASLLACCGMVGSTWAYVAVSGPSPVRDSEVLLGQGQSAVLVPDDSSTGSPDHSALPNSGHRLMTPAVATAPAELTTVPTDTAGTEPPQTKPALNGNRFGVLVGAVDDLYPGKKKAMPVTFANQNSFAIRVTRARIKAVGVRGCPASSFSDRRRLRHRSVLVPAHRSTSTALAFKMRRSAKNGCQGVTVTVKVAARAVKP